MKKIFLSILVSALVAGACKKNESDCSLETATVVTQPLDGCGVRLQLSDGKILEPINFQDFGIAAEEGKKVKISYTETSGVSTCMAGQMVELKRLEEK